MPVVEEVDPEPPKPTPRRVAANTGTTIRRRGHQEQPSADAADVSPLPLRVPPPVIAAPSVSALPATPIHDHDSNPFIAPLHTPRDTGARPVTPTTEQRYWACSPSSSVHPRGTPRAGRHSPTRHSPRRSPRPSKKAKADDVKTFFEDSDDTRSCLFCKYVYSFI